MRTITGAIVAGGQSSRFGGQAKGLLRVDGIRIIDRVLSALRPVVDDVVLIANAPDASTWLDGVPTFRDARAERASLVGIHTALTRTSDSALVVAWDMPFLTSTFLAEIALRARRGADVVVPCGPSGPEPMCAAYSKACLPLVEDALDRGDLKLSSLLSRLPNVERIEMAEIAAFGDPTWLFFNINTAEELGFAEGLAREL